MIKTVEYQGQEYIVTHEFAPGHIWAYREVQHDIIELYRQCMGAVTTEMILVSVLQQVFAKRQLVKGKAV